MTLREFLNQVDDNSHRRKICPNCGEYQCHGIRWCHGDGGEFKLELGITIKNIILRNINFISVNSHSLKWWYCIWRWQMEDKIGREISFEEFKTEINNE